MDLIVIYNHKHETPDTRFRSENSNINHDVNTPCDINNGYSGDVFPASYINTPAYIDTPGNSDLSQSYPIASSDSLHSQLVSQYNDQNATQFIQKNSSLFNSLNMTNYSQINHSEIFTFDIPGIKIIILPIFPPITNSSQTDNFEIFIFDIPGSKVIIITLTFQ